MSILKKLSNRKMQWLLFFSVLLLFYMGRSIQVADSQFTVLLGHTLIHDHTINIRPYLDHPNIREEIFTNAKLEGQQIFRKNPNTPQESWITLYPQAPSYLSIPLIAIFDFIFPVVVGEPPTFYFDNEIRQQLMIAGLLCAFYALLLYRIARLWLPQQIALLATIAMTLGSSLASTLSRAIWSDTWASLLLLLALHHLAHCHRRGQSLRPIYLGILLALAFYCKPIYALPIMAVVGWAFLYDYRKLMWLCLIGGILAVFYMGWSYSLHSTFLTKYDSLDGFTSFRLQAFLGLLIAPSRGVFIFWPWFIFVIMIAPLSWRYIDNTDRKVIGLGLCCFAMLIGLLSFYRYWFGAFGYGPRLQIPALTWISIVSIILLRAWLEALQVLKNRQNRLTVSKQKILAYNVITGFGFLTFVFAVLINMYGVMQPRAFYQWYMNPYPPGYSVEDRMWDWSDPVFLTGIVGRERYKDRPNPYE